MKQCDLCGLETRSTHLSLQHCTKELRERIIVLRSMVTRLSADLNAENGAVVGLNRILYCLVPKDGSVISKVDWDAVPEGARIVVDEIEDNGLRVLPVLEEVPTNA